MTENIYTQICLFFPNEIYFFLVELLLIIPLVQDFKIFNTEFPLLLESMT